MFMCKECHDSIPIDCPHGTFEETWSKSNGVCESCGKVAVCVDCRSHHVPGWIEKLMMKRKEIAQQFEFENGSYTI